LFVAGSRAIRCEINKLVISIRNTEELVWEEWKELFIVPIYRKGDKNRL
jgi:hypothetical protein